MRMTMSSLQQLIPEIESQMEHILIVIKNGTSEHFSELARKLATWRLSFLFMLVENSRRIHDFLRGSDYDHFWQNRLPNKYSHDPETNTTIFDRLMGEFLAFHFEQWVDEALGAHPSAQELLQAANQRGIIVGRGQNAPCQSP